MTESHFILVNKPYHLQHAIRNVTSDPPFTNFWTQVNIVLKYQYKFDAGITIPKVSCPGLLVRLI